MEYTMVVDRNWIANGFCITTYFGGYAGPSQVYMDYSKREAMALERQRYGLKGKHITVIDHTKED